MSEYHISPISTSDKREMNKLLTLLDKEGIERDKNLDYTVGLYDEDYNLAATGSCFKNTLRCMAVDSAHQGEGLLNQVISHLIEYEYENGFLNLFLYTKSGKALFFKDLGFYEIARVEEQVVFMENRKLGFLSYLEELKKETLSQTGGDSILETGENSILQAGAGPVGAVIMNANPFTLGHLHLLETASAACRLLHVFVVSEDISLFPFSVRFELVKQGASHLKNVVFHKTGDYMISNATFPSYFIKDAQTVIKSHAKLDIAVFEKLADALNISARFVGEEPFSQVTGIYNQVMLEALEAAGLECHIIPRKEDKKGGNAISASSVRQLIKENRLELLKDLVPECTCRFLSSEKAIPIIEAIQNLADVVHY